MRKLFPSLVVCLVLGSCGVDDSSKAQEIIDQTMKAHGSNYFMNAQVSFVFRDRSYTSTRSEDRYVYTRSFTDSTGFYKDYLINSVELTRTYNGDTVPLTDEWKQRYSTSINSVLYFIQLPYLLNDPAVVKSYEGTMNIVGENYFMIKVHFQADGGGDDFQDEYLFWINQKNYMMDYLAYNYQSDGGGVRFREAFHRHQKGKIVFQNYINYKAPIGTRLKDLPALFETDQLEELSRIENEKVKVFRKKKKQGVNPPA